MPKYVIVPEIVAQCLADLRKQNIHPNFAGYLCLKRTANRDGTLERMQPDFKEFFDTFLRVPDASTKKPYAMPFTNTAPTEANRWFNANVAGSYAPSSIRRDSPFDRVITITQEERRKNYYTLNEKHWELAYQHLTFKKKIPAVRLAVFLYRDYALEVEKPSTQELVDIFRQEFGYSRSSEQANEEYQYLFVDDSDSEPHREWFEPFI